MPTFLFTDIEGSTRLWEEHPEAMTIALARHDEILSSAVSRTKGRVLKTTGDGVVAVFDDAGDALGASVDAQRGLSDEPWQVGPIKVRMGVHLGETESRDGDFFGPVMNRVARIMAAGHGGQVLLSGAVVDAASGRLPAGAGVRDLGSHRLKDLTLPEHLYQLVHQDLVTDFPAPATLDARPNNLPLQATEFLGRSDEIDAISVMLGSPNTRLLTVAGPGGAGKTRLALQVAAEHLDRFRDGVFFVDLSSERDSNAAYEAIVRVLGLPSSTDTEPLRILESRLRDQEMLLILDNFEQVTAAAVGVAELLQKAPALTVIVTSRETLRVRAEHVFPVPPLSLPHPDAALGSIAQSEAVQLFTERARSVRPGFMLTEDNAAVVAGICLRLDGLPLAIELAAARLNVFTPGDLLERLRTRLDVLGAGGRDLPDRQRTLWGAIGWSYELLDEVECRLFEIMSVFSSASLDAIEIVAREAGVTGPILDPLSSLVDKSLVRSEDADGRQRFAMLLMIKEYAASRLADKPETEAEIRRAHAVYYSDQASRLRDDLRGPERDAALRRVATEIGNLRSAWRFFVEEKDLAQLFKLIDPLWALQEAKGWYQAAIELASDTLAVLGSTETPPEMAAEELVIRTSLARALMAVRGYGPEAEEAFNQVLSMVQVSGGTAAQRFPVLRALATYYMNLTNFEKCAMIGRELIELGEAEGDQAMLIEGDYVFGVGTAFAGDAVTGLTHLDRAAERFDPKHQVSRRYQLGPSVGVVARTASGLIRWQMGALERSVQELNRALEVAREIDHPYSIAYALYHNGFLALLRGRFEECAEFAGQLGATAAEHDYPVWATLAQVLEGISLAALGKPEEGLALTERGVELYQGLSTPPIFWPLIVQLRAQVHAMAGDPARAIQLLEGVLGTGPADGEVSALTSWGDFALMTDPPDIAEAERAYRSAVEISRAGGMRLLELIALTRLVELRRASGQRADLSDDLADLYAGFTEGHDEKDLMRAASLLD